MSQQRLEDDLRKLDWHVARRCNTPPFITIRLLGFVSASDARSIYTVDLAVASDHPLDEHVRKLWHDLLAMTRFRPTGPPTVATDSTPPGSKNLYDVATFVVEDCNLTT